MKRFAEGEEADRNAFVVAASRRADETQATVRNALRNVRDPGERDRQLEAAVEELMKQLNGSKRNIATEGQQR